jgi:hypothetical protein
MTLRSRLARIESGRSRRPPGRFGVVRCLPGESVEEAAQRADAEGYVGALIVPALLDRSAWEAAAAADSAERARLQGEWIAAYRVEPDCPPVVRRRTESDGGAHPQPEAPGKPATVRVTRR